MFASDMPEWANWFLQVLVVPLAAIALTTWLARIAIRRKFVMLLIGLFLLIAGCTLHFKHGALFAPVCNALSSFFPSRGDYGWVASCDMTDGYSQLYYVFHFAVIMYMLSVLLAFFGIGIVNRLAVASRIVLHRPINVFWGVSAETLSLVESMKTADRHSAVFAVREKKTSWMRLQDNESIHVLANLGWKWVYDDPSSCRMLLCAERHFFLGPNGQENIACAEALVKRINGKAGNCTLYVRVDTTADDDVVYKWADRWNGVEDRNVEIIIVREDALVSRKFLLGNPMLQCPRISINTTEATVSGDFKVLFLGFGPQGKTLLSDIICDSQYVSNNGKCIPFAAHVFDHNTSSYSTYAEFCNEAVSRYHIKFEDLEIGSSEFWKQFKAEVTIAPYNRVVVCLNNDRENISIANDIARMYKEMRIPFGGVVFARIRDSLISAYVDSAFSQDESKRTFTPFGAMRETYSFSNIVTRKWEKGAIWLNGDYNKENNEPHNKSTDAALWKKTSSFNKESSRASFFHQRNLLRLIGYQVDETNNLNDSFKDDDPKNHLEVLAEDEHLRWMAFHFVRGVKVWRPSEQEIIERIVRTGRAAVHNAIADINAHADLVDYSELPIVDDKFDSINECYGYSRAKDAQEKDKGFIRSEAMRQSGLGIKKV